MVIRPSILLGALLATLGAGAVSAGDLQRAYFGATEPGSWARYETSLPEGGKSAATYTRLPRGFGSFPRVLGRYARERGVLSLPEAVRRMTGASAARFGLRDRGRIRPGAFADLVLFDPATVIGRATTETPHALSAGISAVWVNGEPVYRQGGATGRRPGRALARESAADRLP